MKRATKMNYTMSIAFVAILAVAALPAMAQRPQGRHGGAGGPEGRGGGGDVARMVLRHVDLTDAQRDAIRDIARAARDERTEESRQAVRDARHEMVRVIWSVDATEADVQAAAARLATLDQAVALDRFRVTRTILAELTPEQQVEVQEFLADPPERRARGSRGSGRGPADRPGSDES